MIFKVGDLVKWNNQTGFVIRVFERKIWRTENLGKSVDFEKIKPEPFAEIVVDGNAVGVPQSDLELVS